MVFGGMTPLEALIRIEKTCFSLNMLFFMHTFNLKDLNKGF